MKKLTALVLTLALMLGAASVQAADSVAGLFPASREYAGFSDVPQTEWYAASVKICYETGLLNGTGSGFAPAGTVTIAEAAALAARLNHILGGLGIPPGTSAPSITSADGEAWYAGAIRYMSALGVTGLDRPEAVAARKDLFTLLSAALAGNLLTPINSITALPDTADADVLSFYNAGILTGTDVYGTFSGDKTLTRAEMAAMTARIIRPELRQTFVPQVKPAGPGTQNGSEVFATFFGTPITRDMFLAELESQYASVGFALDFTADYGVGNLEVYFIDQALLTILSPNLIVGLATQNNMPADTAENAFNALYAALSGGAMRAKHILFSTRDDAGNPLSDELKQGALLRADLILDALRFNPTEEYFSELMASQSEDPGSQSYPNGYVFGSGEMVEEFEAAVLNLGVGEISEVVESAYGYHIILRLDPAGDSDGLLSYVQEQLSGYLVELCSYYLQDGSLTLTDALVNFDVQNHYYNWLFAQQ